VDLILVGDSVGTVLLGHSTTHDVTMDEMLHHCRAVVRGAGETPVVADMPLHAMQQGVRGAVQHARQFMAVGCSAVKIEAHSIAYEAVKKCVQAGIPVMGHVGLTPQSVGRKEKFKARGQDHRSALAIYRSAQRFEASGAFSVVLECTTTELSRKITAALRIPAIGIGAGRECDGQVLVFQDLVGLTRNFSPKFLKRYSDIWTQETRAVRRFVQEVHQRKFPTPRHAYSMKLGELRRFEKALQRKIKAGRGV